MKKTAVLITLCLVFSLCSCQSDRRSSLIYTKGAVPDGYTRRTNESGSLQAFTYETKKYSGDGDITEKSATVYTPYGYDPDNKNTRYNILYLMHGAGGSESTYMGDESDPRTLKFVVDNLIENGDIPPLIIVMPTVQESEEGEYFSGMDSFRTELRSDLVPAVENAFNTYAESTDTARLESSRKHRAFGGFSMGGYITWDTFANDLDLFAWFMPMSCYYYATGSDRKADADGGARLLAEAAEKKGYSVNDFHVFTASGSEDFLHEETKELADSLCAYPDLFKYTDTAFENGNITFYLGEGGKHSFKSSVEYIYNALPEFFSES